jgi:hypothetical protein
MKLKVAAKSVKAHVKAPVKAPAKSVKAPAKSAKAPAKAVKAPAKAVKAPAKAVKAPAKAVKAPVKAVKAPAKAVKAPVKSVKAPAKSAKAPAKRAKAPVKAVKAPVKAVKAPAKAVKAPKLLKEAKAAKAPRKYKKGGTHSPPALPSRKKLGELIKLPARTATSSTTMPVILPIGNLSLRHQSQAVAVDAGASPVVAVAASTTPKAVAVAASVSASPKAVAVAASTTPKAVASTSPIKKNLYNDKLLSIFTLYKEANFNEGNEAFKVDTAKLLNTLKAIFNKGELYKTIEDDLKELDDTHIYIDENHKAYNGKDEKRKQLKDLLIEKQKKRDNYFLTYIHKRYIEPYFIQDNDVVRTTDKFRKNYAERYAEIEAAPIKEQEFEDFLKVLDNIIEDVPTDEMDVYAIISHFKRAYENIDENKETADNFKLYAGVLLKSLRLINEDGVIRKELNILERLDELKSVTENSAFLSRIFTTYIRPHLVIEVIKKAKKYRFIDLSEKIRELQIKRDKVDARVRNYLYYENRETTQEIKRGIQSELRQIKAQRLQQLRIDEKNRQSINPIRTFREEPTANAVGYNDLAYHLRGR